MTYRELLNLYKKGELDEQTAAEVEAAIERQDAIGEYLFEEAEIPSLEGGEADLPPVQEDPAFVKLVQQSIRRAFWKLGVSVCAVVLAGALLAVFVLPRVVDVFYYDPTEVVGTDPENPDLETGRMSLDLAVWTEAFAPGAYRDQAIVTPRGYGRYDFYIPQSISMTHGFTTLGGALNRNRLTLFDPNVLRRPVGNAFVLPGEEDSGAFVDREAAFAAIDELAEDTWYQGYVSLSEIMDYEDFMKWYDSLEMGGQGLWCAVALGEEAYAPTVGFYPTMGGYVLNWDRETYPMLRTTGEDWDRMDQEETAATHFTSMVRYLQDHPQFGEMMGHDINSYWVEQLLESVEQDGLQIYGFSITATKENFEALRQNPNVNYLYTVPAV